MKPIVIKKHTRAITQVKYNREGDLLFTSSRDAEVSVWYTHNGEILGCYDGHGGVVWTLDVNQDTSRLLTGSGDSTCKLWDAERGEVIHNMAFSNGIRCVRFSEGGGEFLVVNDDTMGIKCELKVFSANSLGKDGNPIVAIEAGGSKIVNATWSLYNKYIYTTHTNGTINMWEASTGKLMSSTQGHSKSITDLRMSQDKTFFATSSLDGTAKIYDTLSLECKKIYTTEYPVNSIALSPISDIIILGGGTSSKDVASTSGDSKEFMAKFFDMVSQKEIGGVLGHFGPINNLDFHPLGTGFSSGAEDGVIHVYAFDQKEQ